MPVGQGGLLRQQMEKNKKQVVCLDKNSLQEVKRFNSYADAARWLIDQGFAKGSPNGIRSHIGEVCKGQRKTAYKFLWKNL